MLDKRLVRTFLAPIEVIITFGDRANGLLLSELGGYLKTPDKAPAGTKRRSRRAALLQVGGLAHRSLSSSSEPASSWSNGRRPQRRAWSLGMRVCGRSRRVSNSRGCVRSGPAKPSAYPIPRKATTRRHRSDDERGRGLAGGLCLGPSLANRANLAVRQK